MTTALTCEPELICYICQDLLTENPESSSSSPAKRSRQNETFSEDQQEPFSSSSTGVVSSVDSTPELCSTRCGHIYHKYCLLGWIKRKKVCPTCRREVTNQSLTRVFLPLTAGQCRQCKERVFQMDAFQLKYFIEKTRADACEQKVVECRDISITLAQENEETKEKLQGEIEKVEELEAEVAAEKVNAKLAERSMLENKLNLQQRVKQLEEDLQLSKEQISDKEKAEKVMLGECERTKRENEELKKRLVMKRKKDHSTCKCAIAIQGWKNLYHLKELKIKTARDWEKARADYFEGLCIKILDDPKNTVGSLKMMCSINSESGSAKFKTISTLYSQKSAVNLAEDLEVSESEDESSSQQDNTQNKKASLKSNVDSDDGSESSSDEEDDGDNKAALESSSSCSESSSDSSSDSDGDLSE